MRPRNRNRRLVTIGASALALSVGVWLLLSVLGENKQFFYNPSNVMAEGFVPKSDTIRIGGLVVDGSVTREDGLKTRFQVKDFEGNSPSVLSVSHVGILPDLFREGQGVVVTGDLLEDGSLKSSEVLAKHDENYRPKTGPVEAY